MKCEPQSKPCSERHNNEHGEKLRGYFEEAEHRDSGYMGKDRDRLVAIHGKYAAYMPSSQDTPPNAFWPEPQYRSRSATALALIAGALAVLTLPYLLPMSPVDSDSYFVGFSNRGALVLLLLFLGGFGYWHGPVGRGHPQPETASQKVVSLRKPLVALFACTLVAGIWELAVQHQLGPRQEGLYFFDRLSKLAEGQRMYRDFELAYGALLLYLPVGMHRVLGTSYLTSYSLSLLAQNLIGLGFLGYSVRVVARNCSRKGGILVLFAVTALGWTPLAGAQYTSLRYWSGPAIALFSYQCFQQGHRVRAAIALLAGLAFTLVISPEQSIALILGCCLFAGVFLRCSWPRLLPARAFLTLAEALLLFAAYKLRALDTVLAMGSGAYAVPIVPTPAFLATLAVLAIAACTLVEAIRTQAQGTPELLLLCISLWLLPVAFGRCDAQHMLSNTSAAALVAWSVLSREKNLWRLFFWAYLFSVCIYPTQLGYVYRTELHAIQQRPFWAPKPSWTGLPVFYSPEIAAAPTWTEPLPTFLARNGRYYGLTNVFTQRQVGELIAELRAQTQKKGVAIVHPDQCLAGTDVTFLTHLMGSRLYRRPRRNLPLFQTLCDEIHSSRYRIVDPGSIALPGDTVLITQRP